MYRAPQGLASFGVEAPQAEPTQTFGYASAPEGSLCIRNGPIQREAISDTQH